MTQRKQFIWGLAVLTLLPIVFGGCLAGGDSSMGSDPNNPSTTNPDPGWTFDGGTSQVLQAYKPALAVRGISCLLCHAQVHSSIITDFGYGDAQSFIGSHPGTAYAGNEYRPAIDSKPLTLPWYGNYYGTWQLANEIDGTIIVPKVDISDTDFLASISSGAPSVSLADLIQMDLGPGYYGAAPYSGEGPLTAAVHPLNGDPKVAEVNQIYIGAPTADQILGLSSLSGSSVGWQPIGVLSSISGLKVQAGNGGSYVTNSGSTIHCVGDVVIAGTLFLDNVTVDTDDAGCRIHVSRSAFIQGQVLYTSESGTQNLQISSARAVLLGFSPESLERRLDPVWYVDSQPLTRGTGTNSEKNAALVAEANIIGNALHDSTDAENCPTDMVTYIGYNGGNSQTTLTQCSINFERLLLNAPNIQSRYIGVFKGVVISEIALFAPGALDFVYDTVFDTAPILPLLPPVLSMPDSGCVGSGCGGGSIGI
jgi:hypothetical protein